jgi:hypothetical protein
MRITKRLCDFCNKEIILLENDINSRFTIQEYIVDEGNRRRRIIKDVCESCVNKFRSMK